MKKLVKCASFAASLLSGTLLIAGIANAAPGPTIPLVGSPTSISFGLFAPNGGDAETNGGNEQYSLDFRYALPIPNPLDVPVRTVGDIGLQTGAKDGNHSTVVPFTVGEMMGANNKSPLAGGNTYFGLGAGVYFLNQSGLSSVARLGGYAQLGYNLNSATYLEAKYQFVTHADGLNVNIGLRF